METKICNKCGVEKNIDEFELRKDTGKYRNTCKECRREYCKRWYDSNINYVKNYREENKDVIQEKAKKYYSKNSERLKKYSKEFREQNKDYYSNYNKEYKASHKEEIKEYNKQYLAQNHEQILNYKKTYHNNNRDIERVYRRKRRRERIKTDPMFKLKVQVRHLIYHSFERKGYSKKSRTHEILGCDYETFIKHLLDTYKLNYGIDWDGKEDVHIDHIIPLATANSEEEILKLCNYTNLQLLKAKDNIEKNDKLDWKKE
ncbi:MAG: hypothetical protein IKP28_03550 [Clostridia bacterium]|nr:hypothetical protein [Clostridia bacterium]